MAPAAPNPRLAVALERAGLSHGAAARQLNARARAAGVNTAVNTNRVGRWVSGEHPRDPIPHLLVEMLSELLGVRLTLADIGLTLTGSDPLAPAWSAADVPRSLQTFAEDDMIARRDLMALAVGAPLLAAADRLWQTVPGVPAEQSKAVGADDVAALEDLTAHMRAVDSSRGGALVRRAVVGELATVAELLQHRHQAALTRRLQIVAVDLAQLAGWTSHDSGMPATAQRYWGYAIAMAQAGRDPGRGAEAISRMAHQAISGGRFADALDLLDLAVRTAPASGNPRLSAMLYAQRGRIHAGLGNPAACRADLDRAHDCLSRAPRTADPSHEWIAYFTPAELAGAVATSRRDLSVLHGSDIGPASEAFQQALELRPPGYDRVRALDLIGLAAAHLQEGHPEQAWTAAARALDAADPLDGSALVRARVLTLLQNTDRFRAEPYAKDLRERTQSWRSPNLLPA